jgi:hypothetical protein
MDMKYLKIHGEFLGREMGASGFMLTNLAEWYTYETLLMRQDELREANSSVRRHGIDSNLILLRLGRGELPDWNDHQGWDKAAENFGRIAEIAMEAGCAGLAIDTEPYHNDPWADTTHAEAIEERFFEVFTRIEELAPGSLLFILPAAPDLDSASVSYRGWKYFWRGLVRAKPSGTVVLGAEQTYHHPNPEYIREVFADIERAMIENTPDLEYWREHCTIALGAWPLGRDFEDKGPWYSPERFQGQISTFKELCDEYIWIYAHGSSWWQADDDELGYGAWARKAQAIEPSPDLHLYYKVLRGD